MCYLTTLSVDEVLRGVASVVNKRMSMEHLCNDTDMGNTEVLRVKPVPVPLFSTTNPMDWPGIDPGPTL